jgi:Contractile injection system tube protein
MEISNPVLIPQDAGKPTINFQINPVTLEMKEKNETYQNPGANNPQTGRPKNSQQGKKVAVIDIKDAYFDTDDSGEDVIKKYISPFKEAMTHIKEQLRAPVYDFRWGNQQYFRRCFVTDLSYKIVKFSPEGTPVRAIVSVTLEEADEPNASDQVAAGAPNPNQGNRVNSPQSTSLFSAIGDLFDLNRFFSP